MKKKNRIWLCPLIVMGLVLILTTSCKKEDDNNNPASITDKDGNVYTTVTIGTQVWMVENLKTTKYSDGTSIPNVTDKETWAGLTSAAYCWYNNDAATYKATYCALYNWYAKDAASNGGKNICPTGWHVPNDAEWTILTDYLTNNDYGYGGSGGEIAKSMAATSGWTAHPTAGKVGNDQASNNSSGFTALPSGYRLIDGAFYYVGYFSFWWSATEDNATYAWYRSMFYGYSAVTRGSTSKRNGFSVRCLKD